MPNIHQFFLTPGLHRQLGHEFALLFACSWYLQIAPGCRDGQKEHRFNWQYIQGIFKESLFGVRNEIKMSGDDRLKARMTHFPSVRLIRMSGPHGHYCVIRYSGGNTDTVQCMKIRTWWALKRGDVTSRQSLERESSLKVRMREWDRERERVGGPESIFR